MSVRRGMTAILYGCSLKVKPLQALSSKPSSPRSIQGCLLHMHVHQLSLQVSRHDGACFCLDTTCVTSKTLLHQALAGLKSALCLLHGLTQLLCSYASFAAWLVCTHDSLSKLWLKVVWVCRGDDSHKAGKEGGVPSSASHCGRSCSPVWLLA